MSEFAFHLGPWLAPTVDDPCERETLCSLRLTVAAGVTATRVEDRLAHSVRESIHVPAYLIGRWLLANWWRLRWEPDRSRGGSDWSASHELSAIGHGYAWPGLSFASDGEFVRVRMRSESSADVASIRYLQDVDVDVPVADFERAVDAFLDGVESRLADRVPHERELTELRDELLAERGDPRVAAQCKLQALAGIDPGTADPDWFESVARMATTTGAKAMEEILAASNPNEDFDFGRQTVEAMRASPLTVDLTWAQQSASTWNPLARQAAPWVRGAELARHLRQAQGIEPGPLPQATLADLLGTSLPLSTTDRTGSRTLLGGFREAGAGRTSLVVKQPRDDSQRFYLARLIAAACASAADDRVLAVSRAPTALQKLERSFAQEFLCPWADLDAFTDEHGTDEEGIAEAAEHFMVSEMLVHSTLMNNDKIPRSTLLPHL